LFMQAVKKLISSPGLNRHKLGLMGTNFEFSVVSNDAGWAVQRINSAIAEVKRVDKLLSGLGEDSQTNQINYSAGIAPVKVSGELFRLIARAIAIAEVTKGLFDITYGVPAGYSKVTLNAAECTVFLQVKEMRIYFGGIARGYAADRAKYLMQLEGVRQGNINCGSTVLSWGLPQNLEEAEPGMKDNAFAGLNIENLAAAFAMDAEVAGKSVCVVSPTAELAGALAGALMQLGATAGVQLINRLQQLACAYAVGDEVTAASRFMQVPAIA
jgi:FAD:protein FMN transferase